MQNTDKTMKNPKNNSTKELKLKLMLIAYNGFFSSREMYEKAVEHYRQSDARSVPQAIAKMCAASAESFMNEFNKED